MNTDNIKSDIKKLSAFLRRLICVPICASCMTRLSPFTDGELMDHGKPCFCKNCLSAWHITKNKMCNICSSTADKCTCMPKKNTFMQPTIPSLFFYNTDQKQPSSRAIYTLKHKKNTDLYDFVTDELAPKIKDLTDELEIDISSCIFTNIPRTKKGLRENGFDQSARLSEKLCKKLGGADFLPLLTREGGKEQKRLSREKRRKNAENTIYANVSMKGMKNHGNESFTDMISEKTVILIDDVITTGESLSRGIKVLRASGAKTVLVASVARCNISKNKVKKTKHDK